VNIIRYTHQNNETKYEFPCLLRLIDRIDNLKAFFIQIKVKTLK